MAKSIGGKQAWMTRQGGILEETVHRIEELLTPTDAPTPHLKERRLLQIRQGIKELEMRRATFEKALDLFMKAVDESDLSPDNEEKAQANMNAAQEILENSLALSVKLALHMEEYEHGGSSTSTRLAVETPKLAPLPLPKFRGHLWEWDQFWAIFSTTVHSKGISNIEKLTYLLESLQGPAKDAVKDLQITSENYDLAINLLQRKYGNREAIVARLLQNLQQLHSQSDRISDQAQVLEKLLSIISQLEQKGEMVNTQHMQRTIMGKFSDDIQRTMLRKKHASSSDAWTTRELLQQLEEYFHTEEEIQQIKGPKEETSKKPPPRRFSPKRTRDIPTATVRKYPCFYCGRGDHSPQICPKYSSYEQRMELIRQHNLCRNCGSRDHTVKDCPRGACRRCNEKGHHTSICRKSATLPNPTQPKPPEARHPTRQEARPAKKTTTSQNLATIVANKQSVLRTSSSIRKPEGQVDLLVGQARIWNTRIQEFEDVQMILDTGADQSFITTDYAQQLGLENTGHLQLQIRTFGNSKPVEKTCETTTIEIEDRKGERHHFNVAKIDFIAGQVERSPLDEADAKYLAEHDIRLSISPRSQTIEPRILLGCGDLFTLLGNGFASHHDLPSGLKVLQSRIGSLITGRNTTAPTRQTSQLHTALVTVQDDEEAELAKWDQYWSLDSSGVEEYTGPQTNELREIDRKVWIQFRDTVERHDNGYHVRLPWKEDTQDLPDNWAIAYNRLKSVLAKLKDEPSLLSQYHDTFKDQFSKGIIEEVNPKAPPDGDVVHYLAHQPVLTPHKDTTKLRVVFDGSAHFKNAPCLNDKLHQGPVILPSLIDMLARFRIGNIAIISDVEKAFLQVHLQAKDRDATRCLWIRDISAPLSEQNMIIYRFTRVTFGLKSSPFLLGATILEHLSHAEDQEMADTIKNNVYVDNLLMTASTPDEALEKCEKARKLFAEINMNLREFRTNSNEVNDRLPETILGKSITPKVLGILWNSDDDTMTISCRYPEKPQITKRTISEQVAAVYDPMGWMTPLTLLPKLFLQQLWKHEYKWDQELSEDHQREWKNITAQVQGFTRNLPRRICDDSTSATAYLVAFSDASKNAMAACVYLVCEGSSALVIAKSKLPSIKDNPTIPKLEINALTMATRLVNTVFRAIGSKVTISAIMIFSDSEIALSWLANPHPDQKAGVLVRNRTAEIRRIADDLKRTGPLVKFGYVKTDLNPADCATRGLTRDDLNKHLWWTEPDFLVKEQQAWPQCHELVIAETHEDILPNLTPCVCAAAQVQHTDKEEPIDWTRHSSMSRAVSAFAYALRWLQRLIERVNPDLQSRLLERFPTLHTRYEDNFITVQERRDAMKILIRCHQRVHVANGINYSKDRLFPVTDHDGLIRCRGRLQQSDLSEAGKSPLLLGANTPMASLVIREAHRPHHLATAHTMARVREKYWIPQLRRQVQKILRRCVPCQRMNNLPFRYPQLPDLPARRVTRSRPFQHVGIDYFGPLTIKAGETGTSKAYGIILTCTTTRLLHLETVSDMTTESLINALRRFFARRGVPETVTSDNAPYFLLGDQILHGSAERVAQDTTLARTMATKGILWKTITPYAPWQGAFYERLIKSVKHSLYKSLGKEVVSLERLYTLLVEIEGTLNTRPLTYQEELWEDQPVIRPIDFIQRDMVVTFPLEGLKDTSEDPDYYPTEELLQLRTRKQAEDALRSSHELTERFWKIWREQYLGALREQHTRYLAGGRGSPQLPTVDTVVLVADPNQPRNTWKLGRITEVKSNHEGVVREVELVLPNRRVIRRPINLLVPLELDDTSLAEGQDIVDHTEEVPEQTVEVPEHTEELPQNDTPLLDVNTAPPNHDSERRYHLRNRPRPNYGQLNRGLIPTMIYLCCLTNLCGTLSAQSVESPVRLDLATASGSIQCTTEGILIETNQIDSYELCAEDFCVVRGNSPQKEMIHLPPEVTLHVHTVHLKLSYQGKMKILDTQCPATPFCDHVECWFCTANLFNPECNPRAVIITIAVIIYGIVAILYTFCYVPVVVGLPIRVVFIIAMTTLQLVGKVAYSCYRSMRKTVRQRADGRRSTTGFVPLILVILAVHLAQACQNVDVFEMRATTCVKSSDENETCTFDTTQMLKMNTFHRDACFRIQKQGTLLKEIRLEWIRLQLICDKQTDMFTRHTIQRVVDAKRCPRSGSCRGDKCADINTTAIIPELSQGNAFPGITYCVESCGGPGCGCFYISSGCLFYRIYATPVNNDTYEIFHCPRWREEVVIQKTVAQPHQNMEEETVILQPTIPQERTTMKMTLSSVTITPTPALQTAFITDGKSVAIWSDQNSPTLHCVSREAAQNLECDMHTNCACQPAENKVNCVCADQNITEVFQTELQNRLPVRRPWIEFEEHQGRTDQDTVKAIIRSLSTAEILVSIKEEFDSTVREITDSICTIEDTTITGCYHCSRGALAQVVCFAQDRATMASVQCNDTAFAVPCSPEGSSSSLRFSMSTAQIKIYCETSCGKTKKPFEITGVLHWTKTVQLTAEKLLAGESNVFNEWVLPDIGHIANVFMSWYKFTLITTAVLLIAIAVGYLFIWNHGSRIVFLCASVLCKTIRGVTRCWISAVLGIAACLCGRQNRRKHPALKQL